MFIFSSSNIPISFNQITNELFNNHIIRVNDNYYRLLEIEFYYNDESKHNDTYTHGHPYQKRSGYWYFHPSGIDITIGSEKAPGGILIRSIEKLLPKPKDKKEQYYFGPLNVLTELTSGFNTCFDKKPNVFSLVPSKDCPIEVEQVPEEEIIRSTRIGLSAKDDNYHKSLYRYLIYPHLSHKEKTKIAESLASQWGTDKESLDKIKQLFRGEFLNKYRTKENF